MKFSLITTTIFLGIIFISFEDSQCSDKRVKLFKLGPKVVLGKNLKRVQEDRHKTRRRQYTVSCCGAESCRRPQARKTSTTLRNSYKTSTSVHVTKDSTLYDYETSEDVTESAEDYTESPETKESPTTLTTRKLTSSSAKPTTLTVRTTLSSRKPVTTSSRTNLASRATAASTGPASSTIQGPLTTLSASNIRISSSVPPSTILDTSKLPPSISSSTAIDQISSTLLVTSPANSTYSIIYSTGVNTGKPVISTGISSIPVNNGTGVPVNTNAYSSTTSSSISSVSIGNTGMVGSTVQTSSTGITTGKPTSSASQSSSTGMIVGTTGTVVPYLPASISSTSKSLVPTTTGISSTATNNAQSITSSESTIDLSINATTDAAMDYPTDEINKSSTENGISETETITEPTTDPTYSNGFTTETSMTGSDVTAIENIKTQSTIDISTEKASTVDGPQSISPDSTSQVITQSMTSSNSMDYPTDSINSSSTEIGIDETETESTTDPNYPDETTTEIPTSSTVTNMQNITDGNLTEITTESSPTTSTILDTATAVATDTKTSTKSATILDTSTAISTDLTSTKSSTKASTILDTTTAISTDSSSSTTKTSTILSTTSATSTDITSSTKTSTILSTATAITTDSTSSTKTSTILSTLMATLTDSTSSTTKTSTILSTTTVATTDLPSTTKTSTISSSTTAITTTTKTTTSIPITTTVTATSVPITTTVMATSVPITTTVMATTLTASPIDEYIMGCNKCPDWCSCSKGNGKIFEASGTLTSSDWSGGQWKIICGFVLNKTAMAQDTVSSLSVNVTNACCFKCLMAVDTKTNKTQKCDVELNNTRVMKNKNAATLNFDVGNRTGDCSKFTVGSYSGNMTSVGNCSGSLQAVTSDGTLEPACPVIQGWAGCGQNLSVGWGDVNNDLSCGVQKGYGTAQDACDAPPKLTCTKPPGCDFSGYTEGYWPVARQTPPVGGLVGTVEGENFNVGRGVNPGTNDVIPCKRKIFLQECYIPWGNTEFTVSNVFEELMTTNVEWQYTNSNNSIPAKAVPGGCLQSAGVLLFVGRGNFTTPSNGIFLVHGFVRSDTKELTHAWAKIVHVIQIYEILVWK